MQGRGSQVQGRKLDPTAGVWRSTGRRLRLAAALAALLAALALPAAGDWLVTREGGRVETQGAWAVKGRLVVFSLPNGTLSSLRLSDLDLEASRVATAAAKAPPPAPVPPPPKKPVLVITDADIPRAAAPAEAAGERGAEAETATRPDLEVVSWSQVEDPANPDVQILGTLRNNSPTLALDVGVMVRLLDADGAFLAETPAILRPDTLAPGGTVVFRALFPGIGSFVNVTFETTGSVGARTLAPPPPETGRGP